MNNKIFKAGHQEVSTTFLWMAVAFCVCLISSNIFVTRLWQVGRLPIQLSGAVVIFPVSYILNDCLTEVYGYRKSRYVIWMGFILSFAFTIFSLLVTLLPKPLYEDSYATAESFNALFKVVPRSMLGSLAAFLIGSTANAWVMSKMKVATKGKGFGWRAIISSVVGEFIDSAIFFPIAFTGILPFNGVITLMFTQVVAKTLYEVILLPVTSWFVKKVKAREGIDTYDKDISYNLFKISDI